MSLDNLPGEILVEILRNFESCLAEGRKSLAALVALVEDRKSLVALSRSSRRLHSLSTPHLYHFFGYDWNTRLSSLPLLLRSLLRNPQLGKFIQHVVVFTTIEEETAERGMLQMDVLDDADWKLIDKLISDIRTFYPYDGIRYSVSSDEVSNDEKWYARVRTGNWDAVFALTLYFLSSMQILELTCCGLIGNVDHLKVFMRRAVKSQIIGAQMAKSASGTDFEPVSSIEASGMKGTLLPNFQAIILSQTMATDMELCNLLPLMLLPSVEKFEAAFVYGDDPAVLPDWDTNLKILKLKYSYLKASHLSCLFKHCPKLESLSYNSDELYVRKTEFELMPGLLCLTRTLKRLDLSGGDWSFTDWRVRDVNLRFLKAFEVLTHVSLRLSFLVGQGNPDLSQLRLEEILPRSLQSLYLFGDADFKLHSRLMEHFGRLALMKEEVTPALRQIHIHFWCKNAKRMSEELEDEKVAEVMNICKSKSVEFCLKIHRI